MLTVPIKIKKVHKDAKIPKYMTEGAACFDLVATEIEYLDPNKVIVKFGIAVEVPVGYKLVLQPRSSFTHKSWVMANSPGQIDNDYRGEIMNRFEAIPIDQYINSNKISEFIYEVFPYKVGERVAQAYIAPIIKGDFEIVDELSETKRSENGFGSTGKK